MERPRGAGSRAGELGGGAQAGARTRGPAAAGECRPPEHSAAEAGGTWGPQRSLEGPRRDSGVGGGLGPRQPQAGGRGPREEGAEKLPLPSPLYPLLQHSTPSRGLMLGFPHRFSLQLSFVLQLSWGSQPGEARRLRGADSLMSLGWTWTGQPGREGAGRQIH